MISRGIGKSAARSVARSLSQFGSGSGGVAPPSFTPADLTGLQLWLDASDSSTVLNSISPDTPATDGQTVRRWLDKSGNGLHAEQATAANQPLLDADGQNSKGVLTFDGVNDFIEAGTTSAFNFLHDGTESLMVVVAKVGNSDNPNKNMQIFGTATASSQIGVSAVYLDAISNNRFDGNVLRGVDGAAAVSNITTLTPNVASILEFRYDADNATASERLSIIINNGSEIKNNSLSNAPSVANASFAMRVGANHVATNPFLGYVCELIICSDPNTALRSDLRNYLASKWGITLS